MKQKIYPADIFEGLFVNLQKEFRLPDYQALILDKTWLASQATRLQVPVEDTEYFHKHISCLVLAERSREVIRTEVEPGKNPWAQTTREASREAGHR